MPAEDTTALALRASQLLLDRKEQLGLPKLPGDCNLNVAVRHCIRVGPKALPIEEIGVAPNTFHARTRRDVLEGNPNLFQFACDCLALAPACRIDVEKVERKPGAVTVTITVIGVRFVVFRAGSAILVSSAVREFEPHTFSLPIPLAGAAPGQIRLEGYRSEEEFDRQLPSLAARRIVLADAEPVRPSVAPRSARDRRLDRRPGRRS